MMRPGEPPTEDAGRGPVQQPVLCRRALRPVGRRPHEVQPPAYPEKMDARPEWLAACSSAIGDQDPGDWSNDDILAVIGDSGRTAHGRGEIDDIDHLGNRRVRSVGELAENQFRAGLVRVERAHQERLSARRRVDNLMPHDLINAKPIAPRCASSSAPPAVAVHGPDQPAVRDHPPKRACRPLARRSDARARRLRGARRAPDHYGRICPIETPEGPNIGLINSLATYARVNDYGFLETPTARSTRARSLTDRLPVGDRGRASTSPRPTPSMNDRPAHRRPGRRHNDEFEVVIKPTACEIQTWTSRRGQIVSVAASLIPFLEHDDANRALMGANMQRQAVPPCAPRRRCRHRHRGAWRRRLGRDRHRPSGGIRRLGRRAAS